VAEDIATTPLPAATVPPAPGVPPVPGLPPLELPDMFLGVLLAGSSVLLHAAMEAAVNKTDQSPW